MTKQPLPPITKIAERLLLDIEQAVRGFARYHKYTLGSELRTQAMTIVRLCHRAWRERARRVHWLNELVWAIDELKLSLQMGSQLHAFKSFAQFEQLIRLAEDIGRQADLRRIQSTAASYAGHLRHANSHRLQQTLNHRFPWLRAAARPRRFHHQLEGQQIHIPKINWGNRP